MDLIEYLKHLSGKDIKIKSGKKIIEGEDDDVSTIDEAIMKINKIKKLENEEIKYDLEF